VTAQGAHDIHSPRPGDAVKRFTPYASRSLQSEKQCFGPKSSYPTTSSYSFIIGAATSQPWLKNIRAGLANSFSIEYWFPASRMSIRTRSQ
jgi:hypothetical protein